MRGLLSEFEQVVVNNDLMDLLFYSISFLLVLAIPVAIVVGALRAKRRGASKLGIFFSALLVGSITTVIAAGLGWVGIMVLWGLSI